jgi:hypothetical protein
VVAVLRTHPNPPQAAQAPRETGVAVRNLASVAAVIALASPEPSVRHRHEESDLNLRLSIVKKRRLVLSQVLRRQEIRIWSCGDTDGKAYSVRYDLVSGMVLNEFLKEHRKMQE